MGNTVTDEVGPWKTVHVTGRAPRLLVKYRFRDDGYDVYMTDLSRVWMETLSRAAIVARASSSNCTIEPSEDDQYRILLDKIRSSLHGDEDTSLSLHPGSSDGHQLALVVSAPLPTPLPDFIWTLDLVRTADDRVGSELITPLVLQSNSLHAQIRFLIDEIQSKDRIISKIIDRLETSGNDLTTVFPGVSNVKISRKRAQRPQLAKHVKGLTDFNEGEWRGHMRSDHVDHGFSDHEIDTVFRETAFDVVNSLNAKGSDPWWHSLDSVPAEKPRRTNAQSDHRSLMSSSRPTEKTIAAPTGSSSPDTEFETQDTPPHLKRHNDNSAQRSHRTDPRSPDEREDDEPTESEDDLDAPPKTSSSSQVRTATQVQPELSPSSMSIPRAPRKLGMIGGGSSSTKRNESESHHQIREEPKPEGKAKLGILGGKPKHPPAINNPETASEGHDQGKSQTRSSATREKSVEDPSVASQKSPSRDTPRSRDKLGIIGGKKVSRGTASVLSSEPLSEMPADQPEESCEEDSQERADRKRDQLKRSLEEKAKAPVKKKRRF